MVGKGIEKSSRIFQQCYVKCCKLQNLTPLNNVIPSANGKVLDFCVDRIKYADWPPILNALSCDLSLHSVTIKCRQQIKTVLEHVDCERLAKTVSARCVLLTKFMLSNLVEALVQLLVNNTLLAALSLEGLPLRAPYLTPLCQALGSSSVSQVSLVRCCVGDAGCAALCAVLRARRCVTALELAGCELGPSAAASLADLVHYQKLHRYSENWVHTLRYRAPELDAMAGLRRISLCDNPQLGDAGFAALLDALADDLWIKALDVQGCGLTEEAGAAALRTLRSNTTLVVLDLRHNHVSSETLARLRAALHHNERGHNTQFSWLSNSSSGSRLVKPLANNNGMSRDRNSPNSRSMTTRNTKTNYIRKEKEYTEVLEEQLQEEISNRQQLEELNVQLVRQVRDLKQQQLRLWTSSGSTPSLGASSPSGELSSSSGSSSSVPIDQSTLSYIQHAFSDIYMFIKNNQCPGRCAPTEEGAARATTPPCSATPRGGVRGSRERRRAPANKTSKSAHMLGDVRAHTLTKPEMFERQMGDTRDAHDEDSAILLDDDTIEAHLNDKKSGACSSGSSVSSSTLVSALPAPSPGPRPAPRRALLSSDESDHEDLVY